MKAHSWILPAAGQRRIVSAEGLMTALRTDAMSRAASGIAITALMLGSLGTDVAVTSGHASSHHSSTRHHHAGHHHPGHISARPWMY
jgi:hypothetical protein